MTLQDHLQEGQWHDDHGTTIAYKWAHWSLLSNLCKTLQNFWKFYSLSTLAACANGGQLSIALHKISALFFKHLVSQPRNVWTYGKPCDGQVVLPMATYGQLWQSMESYGDLGQVMAILGNLWQLMATHGNLWQLMATYGNLWQPLATYGNSWQPMATYGNLWQLMATYGNLWQLMATYGNLWQLMAT